MGRRKKGRAVDGWLIVDKPEGVGSTQVVSRARWAFEAQKAGHAGTLDPLATGLLAIAFGEATKTVPYAQDGLKTYRFTARWGRETSSDDRGGEVTETSAARPDLTAIEAALPQFTGEIMQRPPSVSAIKVDGRRAYDLAREGAAPDLAARPIWIERLALLGAPAPDLAEFEMICGKGGYVRSIARDLGRALGCLGHVETLRRVASGGFSLNGAIGWEELEALRDVPARDGWLLPVEAGLSGLTAMEVSSSVAERLVHGDAGALPAGPAGEIRYARYADAPVAVYRCGPPHRLLRVFALSQD